ncbi:hypothetical protein [Aneurinibacillus migulanus]|uniref:hypothetical protein n=1 Tax=Aneurinibacillus migulanus TaxID=47500 RepID=UPI001167CD39|nr:hypothetical protein [Aneurinibacillus migulanus]GED17482.1 hypothetical protein AMI01nite_54730 [Aneurinibacillus migulanus]
MNDPGRNYRAHYIDSAPKTKCNLYTKIIINTHISAALMTLKKIQVFKYGSSEAVAEATKRSNKLKGKVGCGT